DAFKSVLKQQHIFGTPAFQRRGHCHGARKRVCPFYLLSDTPFDIRRNEQGDISEILEFQYKVPYFTLCATEYNKPADALFYKVKKSPPVRDTMNPISIKSADNKLVEAFPQFFRDIDG